VTAVNASASSGHSLLTLASRGLQVSIPIPAGQVNAVHVGESVRVSVTGVASAYIQGHVQSIAPAGAYTNGLSTFSVTVSLPEVSGIHYGMSAQLLVVVRRHGTR
jgi:hypothetical protein